ncbi:MULTISPECIES: GNAT family N-acetyltransferase [Yersinia]|mgnify:FL=1|jgi:N-acetylglutamate synthase-like GNAT family acetyltransferase|uniref:Acetyltransferase n=1 Tax=Yersinia intermedia TaxID=631 RepID=A0A0T9M6D1_YERIN|nr:MULTISPECIES: GNAT family N-acetyltransferase [Yersinia]AJJ19138.1 acetyltransferase domain protein [Yersinia intermedia]ARB86074.1 N-acetyltransferase [Yersinia sp. FDAARGOS_228]AVL35923.1 N-acetyltransferase [Yersinia intermedia]EEQ20602.1 GCN5-related N-acetyltransferase [Yersinia intermedia ATCC 29909]MCW8111496.1 GNAT family N-acetyltransferase [Yersinia intermedia]
MIKIISVRSHPEYKDESIRYFQNKWATEETKMLYQDCISHCIEAKNPLPQWYLMEMNNEVIGCAGLITNDFISRMDLYPWLCALYIEEQHRGHAYGQLLIKHIAKETKQLGFDTLHLCTDHIGFYEKYGFTFTGLGYHPWGESSRIYSLPL